MIIVEQSAELVDYTSDAAFLIERVARVCHRSEGNMDCGSLFCFDDDICDVCKDRNTTFLKSLISRGHDTPFEFAHATFKIVTDRGISHELVRHRMASYMQESTRYVDMSDLPVIDSGFQKIPPVHVVEAAERWYKYGLRQGESREIARDILPTCTATTLYMSANFREWKHILTLRMAKAAHPKMRELAGMIHKALVPLLPVYFEGAGAALKQCRDAVQMYEEGNHG